ncbi:hypothetical protein TEA_024805 [Camellia sinensis var. sinensis]|uniref:Uncharacterized protein n=1 Tax=Camellia sinensis var. sinensis TaxID=542762 RepID=A0A4S4D1L7_CAMSN|nr:hypothetical protein TEA_024805 [Camellia sinensis var. sinensis]
MMQGLKMEMRIQLRMEIQDMTDRKRLAFHHFHFNIATISIETDVALPTAIIRPLDDSISIDPRDMVVAIGRSCGRTHALMAAPGKFRKSRRPWHGMEMTNLYAASVGKLEKIISKFNISKGILVEEAHQGAEGLLGLKCKARRASLQQGAAFQ